MTVYIALCIVVYSGWRKERFFEPLFFIFDAANVEYKELSEVGGGRKALKSAGCCLLQEIRKMGEKIVAEKLDKIRFNLRRYAVAMGLLN